MDEGLQVFFLGGQGGSAEEAARRLRAEHPSLRIVVYESPLRRLDDMDDQDILDRVRRSGAQILLVAFGHPKQEKWISRHLGDLPPLVMGVGCCLDLLSGRSRRAPMWMQRCGLEWCYRVLHEPRRLVRRYLIDGLVLLTLFVPGTLLDRLRPSAVIDVTDRSDGDVVVLQSAAGLTDTGGWTAGREPESAVARSAAQGRA